MTLHNRFTHWFATTAAFSFLLQPSLAAPLNGSYASCAAGMDGTLPSYTPPGFNFSGNVRRYYISAEIESWDYAPTGWDNWLGVPFNQSFRAQQWGYVPTDESIGTVYDKALYRGYTGPDFNTRIEQPAWQGFLGPTIRAEVGDMVEIMFVNNLESFYASIHSMGLFYLNADEGSLYYKGSPAELEDALAPGDCVVYKWLVPATSGPKHGDNSRLLSYHSYVSMYQDADAGLSGPVIIYNSGMMNSTLAQNREFIIFYGDNQESNSFLALQNVQKYLPKAASQVANLSSEYPRPTMNESIWYPQMINGALYNVSTTMAANFFPINGYIYANSPAFEMCLDDTAIWYLLDLGFDTHVAHWHGNNVIHEGNVTPSVPMNPGQGITVLQNAVNPGWWQFICHFNTHLSKGMEANYIIYRNNCPLPPLAK